MYKLFYEIFYSAILTKRNYQIKYRLIVRIANRIFPAFFKSVPSKPSINGSSKDNEIIVSLTSFPSRINKVWLVIESILHQTVKPTRIVIWLYNGEFPDKESLPKALLQLEHRGLEIRFCDENLMPHKKYYYTFKENPNSNIITIDDDIFYPPDLIEKLIKFHLKDPKAIICPISRRIKLTNHKIHQYKDWDYNIDNRDPSHLNLSIGAGSIFYPANCFHQDVLNVSILKKLALTADDLWLKIMSLKANTKVMSIAGEYPITFIPILFDRKVPTLMSYNVHEGGNDLIFSNLMDYYNLSTEIFEKE